MLSIILKKTNGLYIAPNPLKIDMNITPIYVINSIWIDVLKIILIKFKPKIERILFLTRAS